MIQAVLNHRNRVSPGIAAAANRRRLFYCQNSSDIITMWQDTELATFLDMHVSYATETAAIYEGGFAVHETTATNTIALALFSFVAKTTRDIEQAEKAEADFRHRVALLSTDHGQA